MDSRVFRDKLIGFTDINLTSLPSNCERSCFRTCARLGVDCNLHSPKEPGRCCAVLLTKISIFQASLGQSSLTTCWSTPQRSLTALNTLLILLTAVCIPGLINRTRAVLAGRRGIRFAQHLYDVRLLLRKGAVYSTTASALFRAVPSVYLGSAIVAALFIPVGELKPLLSFDGDIVCFAYLMALGRFALILGAMDTGSSFEGMGASREALYGALVEPALMLTAGTLALLAGHTSFARIFAEAATGDLQLTVLLVLTAYVLVKIVFTESGRVPVDDPRTHLELTMIHEVMCLDYCGVDLAYIKMAGWLKTAALSVLAADAVAATCCPRWWAAAPLAVLVTGLSVGIVESTQARNKLARNTTFILTVAALAVLVFFTGYLLQLNIGLQ